MAGPRMGNDRYGMNDLPIPGQPDFNMNTMRPTAPPPPDPRGMTQFAPEPEIPMYHSMNIPPPPDAMIDKLMAPAPTAQAPAPQQTMPPPTLRPDAAPADPAATGDVTSIPAHGRGPGGAESSWENLQRNQRNPGGNDLAAAAAALGIPLAVLALLMRRGRGAGAAGGGPAAEVEKALQLTGPGGGSAGGANVTPMIEDMRPRAYGDDTIAPATDEARARVNDAYNEGGTAKIQGQQDAAGRQAAINSGEIKPQDYAAGEKPKPGTPGYKEWFKYRQDQSRVTKKAK